MINRIRTWYQCWKLAGRLSGLSLLQINLMESRMRRHVPWSDHMQQLFDRLREQKQDLG
jgi:hypothetical protein